MSGHHQLKFFSVIQLLMPTGRDLHPRYLNADDSCLSPQYSKSYMHSLLYLREHTKESVLKTNKAGCWAGANAKGRVRENLAFEDCVSWFYGLTSL